MPTTPRGQSGAASTHAPRARPRPSSIRADAASTINRSTCLRRLLSSLKLDAICFADRRSVAVSPPSCEIDGSPSNATASSGRPSRPHALTIGAMPKEILSASTRSFAPMPASRANASNPGNPLLAIRAAPSRAIKRFSPRRGTTSATVPNAASASVSTSNSRSIVGTRSLPHHAQQNAHPTFQATAAPQSSVVPPPSPGCAIASTSGKTPSGSIV